MAGLDLAKAAFNIEAVSKGRWVPIGRGGEEAEFCIARWNNPEYRALETQLYQKARRERRIKDNNLPADVMEEITLKLVVLTILKDWRGLNSNGVALPCTKENKFAVLGNESYRWILEDIIAAAREEEAYQQEAKEEDLGNSASVSDSASNGASETLTT